MIAVVHGDQSARLWDRRTGRLLAEPKVPKVHGVTNGVAFSGDGSRVVVGTDKGWVHSFNTSSGSSVGTPLRVMADLPAPASASTATGAGRALQLGAGSSSSTSTRETVLRWADVGFQVEAFAVVAQPTSVAVSGQSNADDDSGRVGLLEPAKPPSEVGVQRRTDGRRMVRRLLPGRNPVRHGLRGQGEPLGRKDRPAAGFPARRERRRRRIRPRHGQRTHRHHAGLGAFLGPSAGGGPQHRLPDRRAGPHGRGVGEIPTRSTPQRRFVPTDPSLPATSQGRCRHLVGVRSRWRLHVAAAASDAHANWPSKEGRCAAPRRVSTPLQGRGARRCGARLGTLTELETN